MSSVLTKRKNKPPEPPTFGKGKPVKYRVAIQFLGVNDRVLFEAIQDPDQIVFQLTGPRNQEYEITVKDWAGQHPETRRLRMVGEETP